MTDFDFDPKKNLSNIEKHGVELELGSQIWDGFVFEREDRRRDYGERRLLALGRVNGRVFFVAYTWRGSKRRLISVRKANRDEQEIYHAALARHQSGEES